MDVKGSIISFMDDPYSRSHLPKCVPSRRRARGPYRNLTEPAAPSRLELM